MKCNLILAITTVAILTTACDKKEILTGKREPIFGVTVVDTNIGASQDTSSKNITPSVAENITSHLDVGGNKQHNSINYKMDKANRILWKTSIGGGPISSDMISLNGNIYVINSNGTLFCISLENGKKIWKKDIAKQPDGAVFSGGMTANENTIYINTNIGTVLAIDSKTQKQIWEKSLKYPLKGSPLYTSGKLIVTSVENQTVALDAGNGNILWTKTMNKEQTVMAEFGTPAVFGNDVICAYSSGEVVSLDFNIGTVNWEDVLFSSNLSESGGSISHIVASPIVFKDNILTVTSESKMVMFDAKSGIRIWENNLGSLNLPIINNGWIFVLSSNDELVCLSSEDGSIKWSSNINDLRMDSKYKVGKWTGPLIINGDIVVLGDSGESITVDISTGKSKGSHIAKNPGITRQPLIINGRMYAVTPRSEVIAIG